MSEICIYVKMPSYLRQWLVHRHGGCEPIQLVRGSTRTDAGIPFAGHSPI